MQALTSGQTFIGRYFENVNSQETQVYKSLLNNHGKDFVQVFSLCKKEDFQDNFLSWLFIECLTFAQKENALLVLEKDKECDVSKEWMKGMIAVVSVGNFEMTKWVFSHCDEEQTDFLYCLFLAVGCQEDLRIVKFLCNVVGMQDIEENLFYALRRAERAEKDERLRFLQKAYLLFGYCSGNYESKTGFDLLKKFIRLEHFKRIRATKTIYFWIFPKLYRNEKFVLEQASRSYSKLFC